MKLGLLIYGSLDTLSGGYIYDRYLVAGLRARGHTVEIISLPWRNYAAHLGDNFARPLIQRLRALQLDALLQDELCHPSLWRANTQLRAHSTYPLIALVHHLRASEKHPAALKVLYRQIEKRYLHSVDGFIFNSRTTRLSVAQHIGGLPPSTIAYPGGNRLKTALNVEQIKRRAGRAGPLRILLLGSITRRKQPHLLLEACFELKNPAVKVTLMGSQQPEPRYARRIQALSARLRHKIPVELVPPQTVGQLPHHLSQHDVLIVPSSYEGFGIVYLEGMAFGLPAIATTAGAAHETIQHGENGFLIDPNDSRALASYIDQLASDRNLLAQMSVAARHHFQHGPTWEQMSVAVHQYLEDFFRS